MFSFDLTRIAFAEDNGAQDGVQEFHFSLCPVVLTSYDYVILCPLCLYNKVIFQLVLTLNVIVQIFFQNM